MDTHALTHMKRTRTSNKAVADSVTLDFGANVGNFRTISYNFWPKVTIQVPPKMILWSPQVNLWLAQMLWYPTTML